MFDSSLVLEGSAVGVDPCPAVGVDAGPGLIDSRLGEAIRVWWLGSRPGWVDPGWYGVPVRSEVAALTDLPAGAGLVAALERLPSLVPCPFPHGNEGGAWPGGPLPGSGPGALCACQVMVAAAWEAVSSWAQARCSTVVVDLAGVDPVVVDAEGSPRAGRVADPCREELAAAWRVSPQSAACRIESARRLVELPGLAELAVDGVVGWSGVRGVESVLRELGPDEARAVVELLVSRVRTRVVSGLRPWTASEVRQAARRIVTRSGVQRQERALRAERERGVWLQPISEHLSELVAVLPGAQAHVVYRRITNLARELQRDDHSDSGEFADNEAEAVAGAGPGRSLDNIRADVLVDLVLGQGHGADPGSDPGSDSGRLTAGVQVGVTVGLGSLLGLVDEPGELAGYGPIPAEVARELAADGSWRLWVTDPGARVVATGCRTYRPSVGLARLVRARLPHCRFPGCRRPSTDCDLDHVVAWPAGATEVDNLGPLCRRHHNLKTHAGWRIEVHDDGSWSWTSPTETTHHDHPPPVDDTG